MKGGANEGDRRDERCSRTLSLNFWGGRGTLTFWPLGGDDEMINLWTKAVGEIRSPIWSSTRLLTQL